MGTQQSGVLNLRIADIVKDSAILQKARSIAIDVLKNDPNLSKSGNRNIYNTYIQITKNKNIWANIS
jgi:ATP-dependent DNA helicase RecG